MQISQRIYPKVQKENILWYYVDTSGKNTKKIAEYIKNQSEEDKLQDQISFREYEALAQMNNVYNRARETINSKLIFI